jgi:hypothetical protein
MKVAVAAAIAATMIALTVTLFAVEPPAGKSEPIYGYRMMSDEGMGPGSGMGSGKGPGYGPGPRADCPAGQDCPGPRPGKGPGPRQ